MKKIISVKLSNMEFNRLIAGFSYKSLRFNESIYKLVNAILSGFWLGIMNESSLDFADEMYYGRVKMYSKDSYNTSGLYDWEKLRIEKYFSNAKSILLLAAGAGREVFALSKMGFKVESYECNLKLIEYGNVILKENNVAN